MEIIAVYYEYPVKTYGVKLTGGFCMVEAQLSTGWSPEILASLARRESLPGLVFSSVLPGRNGGQALHFCLPEEDGPRLADMLAELPAEGIRQTPAGLIHLQGPHFGDRFGIAALVLEALEEAGVKPLSLAGVVHSLFLALAPGDGPAALRTLAGHFSDPS